MSVDKVLCKLRIACDNVQVELLASEIGQTADFTRAMGLMSAWFGYDISKIKKKSEKKC